MTYCTDRDQDQRLESYEAIEAIYLEGIGDAADGRLPAMAEFIYIQGYVQGMRDYPRREIVLPVINADECEFPLVCHQCTHFDNGICSIKSLPRNSNSYACDRINVDCPF